MDADKNLLYLVKYIMVTQDGTQEIPNIRNSTMNDTAYTRRVFLHRGLTLASMVTTAPLFIQRSALGMAQPAGALTSSQPGVPQDRVLVVLQLGGGNERGPESGCPS